MHLNLSGLFKRLLFAAIFLPFFRLLFIFFNLDYLANANISDVVIAYFYGFRFDFSTALIINLFFILFSLVPLRHHGYQNFLKCIFVAFNSVFLIFNIVDLEFFPFLGKKLTIDIFDIGGDIGDQAFQLVFNYWYLTLMSFGLIYILWKFYPKGQMKKIAWYKWLGITIGMILFTGIGIRGGAQMRSISPKQAFIFDQHELGNVALNAAYTMARSLSKKPLPSIRYFKTDREAFDFIKSQREFSASDIKRENTNVVIIIIESLSQEYIEMGYTPKLKERFKQGLYFSENYANGRRSIEALPSILLGLPSIVGKPIYQSQFQTNKFIGLPQVLKNRGYQTSFFHGGKTGTMDFDAFVASIGVDLYYGKEDYPDESHYDGNWGIYDHHFLNFFHQKMNEMREPFFTSIFTLSSHQPYSIPDELEGKFPKGNLEIHESIGYIDYALDEFFKAISDEPWFKNTLFILTSDHTQKLETTVFNNELGRYRVPLWFYHPAEDLSRFKIENRIAQHADIYPSVLDMLGIEAEKLYFGSSVFNQDSGMMINYASGHFIMRRGEHFMEQKSDEVSSNPENERLEELLKAYIQYGLNGLKHNNIYR